MGGLDLTIRHVVTGSPDGTVAYTLRLARGQLFASVDPVPAGEADVVLTTDYPTAVAIHQGALTAQEAATAGRVKIGGDSAALVRHAPVLSRLGASLAPLRDETTY
jgi:hypothetical protein